jgi:hypothetical protein
MAAPRTLPLSVLVSRVLGQITSEVEVAAGVGPSMPSLAMWSNVLRCVAHAGPGGMEESALPRAARLSSRLTTAAVTGAARRGWIGVGPGEGKKSRHIELADAGRAAAEVWPVELATLDGGWRSSPLRALLEELVAQVPIELPYFPASYGTADPSAIGGPYMQESKKPEGTLVHANDWRPVPRRDGDTVSSLPITALLSQALMAFTIDYENQFPWPLANTATVLCQLSAVPIPLADVAGDHGITGNGKSLTERHLIAVVSPDPANTKRKLVALTDRGVLVMKHHPERLDAVDAMWREQFGDALVTGLRDALTPLADAATDQPDHVIAPLHLG